MNSILTNSAALSALQSLSMTQQDLGITQNQVSSGLAVQSAADNAAYWAIGQQLTSDSGIVTAANTALAQSQSVLDTATSAIALGHHDDRRHPGRDHRSAEPRRQLHRHQHDAFVAVEPAHRRR